MSLFSSTISAFCYLCCLHCVRNYRSSRKLPLQKLFAPAAEKFGEPEKARLITGHRLKGRKLQETRSWTQIINYVPSIRQQPVPTISRIFRNRAPILSTAIMSANLLKFLVIVYPPCHVLQSDVAAIVFLANGTCIFRRISPQRARQRFFKTEFPEREFSQQFCVHAISSGLQ